MIIFLHEKLDGLKSVNGIRDHAHDSARRENLNDRVMPTRREEGIKRLNRGEMSNRIALRIEGLSKNRRVQERAEAIDVDGKTSRIAKHHAVLGNGVNVSNGIQNGCNLRSVRNDEDGNDYPKSKGVSRKRSLKATLFAGMNKRYGKHANRDQGCGTRAREDSSHKEKQRGYDKRLRVPVLRGKIEAKRNAKHDHAAHIVGNSPSHVDVVVDGVIGSKALCVIGVDQFERYDSRHEQTCPREIFGIGSLPIDRCRKEEIKQEDRHELDERKAQIIFKNVGIFFASKSRKHIRRAQKKHATQQCAFLREKAPIPHFLVQSDSNEHSKHAQCGKNNDERSGCAVKDAFLVNSDVVLG